MKYYLHAQYVWIQVGSVLGIRDAEEVEILGNQEYHGRGVWDQRYAIDDHIDNLMCCYSASKEGRWFSFLFSVSRADILKQKFKKYLI